MREVDGSRNENEGSTQREESNKAKSKWTNQQRNTIGLGRQQSFELYTCTHTGQMSLWSRAHELPMQLEA